MPDFNMMARQMSSPYSRDDIIVQLANYGKLYDMAKYSQDRNALPQLNKLMEILGQLPNGQTLMRRVEYDVDMKYGKVPKRRESYLEDLVTQFVE